jgi:hypothetical protein
VRVEEPISDRGGQNLDPMKNQAVLAREACEGLGGFPYLACLRATQVQ